MSVRLTKGTKEYVNVVVVDETAAVGSLVTAGATNVKFDVKRDSDNVAVVTDQAATLSGMTIQCLVDTSTWNAELHNLYAKFTLGSEDVVLGPYEIYVVE